MPMKVKTKKQLIKACDIAWSKAVHLKGNCEMCNSPGQNAHHVIGRINRALRWDLRNGCLLCISCHKFSKTSAHNDPQGFMEWFKQVRPDDYEYLKIKKNELAKYLDYEEILKQLKEVSKNA